jgi:hypothetical protein
LQLYIADTLAGDYLLHRLSLVWVGHYMGIPGALLIIGSIDPLLGGQTQLCQHRQPSLQL